MKTYFEKILKRQVNSKERNIRYHFTVFQLNVRCSALNIQYFFFLTLQQTEIISNISLETHFLG